MDNLEFYRYNITSQNGEDGIIAYLRGAFKLAPDGWCCEFGAWDGMQLSNTYALRTLHKYRAILMEADESKYNQLLLKKLEFDIPVHCEVSTDADDEYSLNSLLFDAEVAHGMPCDFDLLSIDVDGFEYSIWKSLGDRYIPKIVVVEVNPYHNPDVEFIDGEDPHLIHLGTTPKPMVALAKEKGYELVAHTGCNLIFVRKDLYHLVDLTDNSWAKLYDYTWVKKRQAEEE